MSLACWGTQWRLVWLGQHKLEGSQYVPADTNHGKQSRFYSVCWREASDRFKQECDLTDQFVCWLKNRGTRWKLGALLEVYRRGVGKWGWQHVLRWRKQTNKQAKKREGEKKRKDSEKKNKMRSIVGRGDEKRLDPGYILKVVLKEFVDGFDVQCVRDRKSTRLNSSH